MDLITNVMGSTPSPLRSWQPKSDKVSQARVSLEEDSRVKKAKSAKTVGFFHKPIYNPNPEIDTLDNSSNASLGTGSLASKEAAERHHHPILHRATHLARIRVPPQRREGRGIVEQISRSVIHPKTVKKVDPEEEYQIHEFYEACRTSEDKPINYQHGLSNYSNVVMGDHRIRFKKSFSQECFKLDGLRARRFRNKPNTCIEKTARQRMMDYKEASDIVGEEIIDDMEQLMRDKLQQRTSTGPFQLRRTFKYFDRDGSGGIDLEEFSRAMRSLGFDFADVQLMALFARYDTNRTGFVDYSGFVNRLMEGDFAGLTSGYTGRKLSMMIHKKFMQDKPEDARVEPPEDAAPEDTEKKRSEALRVFNLIDRDQSGSINTSEMALLLTALGKNLTQQQLEAGMQTLDCDQSGEVDFDEFYAWFLNV